MTTYAIGHLTNVEMGPQIKKYLNGIDATLKPYGGKFRIHGGPVERLEGSWSGNLIAIEFPDREHACNWYESDAYKAILPLRTDNSNGHVFLIDGVSEDHRATDILK